MRRSTLPACVFRQYEKRPTPLVRYGDVRQSRQGGASSGEVESALSPVVEVVRTYLELRSPSQLRASRIDDPAVRFVRRPDITVDEYRRVYRAVGARWRWTDRN